MLLELPAEIKDRIAPEPYSGCWLWTGALLSSYGYGQWPTGHYAHRTVYELIKGPIPQGLELDHLCRIPICVNPDHLEPVTHLVNVQRGKAGQRQRLQTHCKHGHAFTPENTIWRGPDGRHRDCLTCQRKWSREWMRRQATLNRPERWKYD
jgi:HNH endonuclease